jgi:hypothetical protein
MIAFMRGPLLALVAVSALSCATPASTSAPTTTTPPPPTTPSSPEAADVLRPCLQDQFRQVICGTLRRDADTCPARPTDMEVAFTGGHIWQPDLAAMEPDEDLTSMFRTEGEPWACCYSGCATAPVHWQAHVSNDYAQLRCIPAMQTSVVMPDHPGCPVALEFPDDMPGHVAPFDPVGTGQVVTEWTAQGIPVLPRMPWCCYRSAPIAAIGPM